MVVYLWKISEATTATHISNVVVFCLIGLIVSKIFIPVFAERLRKKRIAQLKLQFRDFLVALSNSISGGMNVSSAFNNAYKDLSIQYSNDALIVKEIGEIINGMQNNITIDAMLADLGKRSDDPDIENFATVFKLCFKSGGNLKEVIRRTSDIITTKIAISEEIQTSLSNESTTFNYGSYSSCYNTDDAFYERVIYKVFQRLWALLL